MADLYRRPVTTERTSRQPGVRLTPVRAAAGLLLAVLCTGHAQAQPSPPVTTGRDVSTVGAIVAEEMERRRVPGLAVAILKGQEVLLSQGYGLANLEHRVPVTPETMFQSGSMGKMFTAAAVLALAEQGTLDLEAPVGRYLTAAPASWSGIRLRHLLTHTSGIPDYTSDTFDYRRDYTEADLERMALMLPLEFPAGQRWNYSNTGYVLLGVVISRVTGKPYWEYLRERLFSPAGMPTARVISEADVVPHRAAGYLVTPDGRYTNQNWVAPLTNTTADGSLLVSLNDMVAWARAVRERRVISADSWARAHTPVTLTSGRTYPYGMAWFLDTVNGQPYRQHGGAWQGFLTQFSYYASSDLTIIVLANSRTADPLSIATRLAAAVDPTLASPPAPTTPISGVDPKVLAYVRQVLEKTQRGELALDDFEFVRQTTVPRISASSAATLAPLGALQVIEPVARTTEGDDTVLTVLARGAQGTARVTVKLGPAGRLTGLTVRRGE
jgi:CubicO group peptidase (beta-lactamase class C family)